ncbi:MAG: sugar nucleotide-binding protein [Candidatus Margulisiibacteriota bacterium]
MRKGFDVPIETDSILLFGATGLLGKALLCEIKSRNIPVVGVARSDADLCMDIQEDKALVDAVHSQKFSIIINACAIVNHQLCETDPGLAYRVNARPSAILADLAQKTQAYYVFVSTDGFYHSHGGKKHSEQEDVVLLNEYARTKYCGERFTLLNSQSLVVRTNIVGFSKRSSQPTFVEWILQSIAANTPITLFEDYFTSSLTVAHFSTALCNLLGSRPSGLLNLASSQVFSKSEFIQKLIEVFQLDYANYRIGSVNELKGPKRADSLGLDVSKAHGLLGYKLPNLEEVIEQLRREYHAMG